MLFFTKICIAVHSIERARSIARCTPPPIDMCAPSRIADCRFLSADRFSLVGGDFAIDLFKWTVGSL
jgi:hypothetical protein